MTDSGTAQTTVTPAPWRQRARRFHRWIRIGFVIWGVTSTLWMFNSMRTQGVDASVLQSDGRVTVLDDPSALEFAPADSNGRPGLIFFCGAGVAAHAYAPLVRPIADAGHRVVIVKLPYRLAPLPAHAAEALSRARRAIDHHADTTRWVVAGHSFGAVLAARMARTDPEKLSSLVLIGTTHPKEENMSALPLPVIKVYGADDGVAPAEAALANAPLLPPQTKWVRIEGGNHSQFAHYGHQLFDGAATIPREQQQALTRAELLGALESAIR